MIGPNGTTPGRNGQPGRPQPRPSTGATLGRGIGSGRQETAPRRSELRRSGDYSGPSAVPGCVRQAPGHRRMSVVPGRYGAARGRRCSTASTPTQRDAVTSTRRAARDPRRRGLGQDAGAHPPHRVAVARAADRSRATSSRSRSPARPPASSRSRLEPTRRARVGHRRHVPRHRARAAPAPRRRAGPHDAHAPRTQGADPRARCCRCAAARPRCSPPSWRPRSSGPRPAW